MAFGLLLYTLLCIRPSGSASIACSTRKARSYLKRVKCHAQGLACHVGSRLGGKDFYPAYAYGSTRGICRLCRIIRCSCTWYRPPSGPLAVTLYSLHNRFLVTKASMTITKVVMTNKPCLVFRYSVIEFVAVPQAACRNRLIFRPVHFLWTTRFPSR